MLQTSKPERGKGERKGKKERKEEALFSLAKMGKEKERKKWKRTHCRRRPQMSRMGTENEKGEGILERGEEATGALASASSSASTEPLYALQI